MLSLLTDNSKPEPTYIIGVGASAGGLNPLKAMFKSKSAESLKDCAFVVTQHLSPNYKSSMLEILEKDSNLKFINTLNDQNIECGCVYLTPPGVHISLKNNRLMLMDKPPTGEKSRHLIDNFFTTLAKEKRKNCVAVILSGTGSDGTIGVKKIKENNGLVICQDPNESTFDGMPTQALETDVVDIVCKSKDIFSKINNYISTIEDKNLFDDKEIEEIGSLKKIFNLIQKTYNLDLNAYKSNTINRRLKNRFSTLQISNGDDYLDYLYNDPSELEQLFNNLLVPVTNFFRDQTFFELITDKVLPHLISKKEEGDPLRIWSAGCSSGQEPYSIAISIEEYIRKNKLSPIDYTIFATDINPDIISKASRGVYQEKSFANLKEKEHVLKYFNKINDTYIINKKIRSKIIFSTHNIFKDIPFKNIDLLSCRNLLIYLKQEFQKSSLKSLFYALKDTGTLLLGPSESLHDLEDSFKAVNEKWRIFQKKQLAPTKKKTIQHLLNQEAKNNFNITPINNVSQLRTKPSISDTALSNCILDSIIRDGIFIDPDNNITHSYGLGSIFLNDINRGKINISLSNLTNLKLKDSTFALIEEAKLKEKAVKTGSPISINNKAYTLKALPIKLDQDRYSCIICIQNHDLNTHDQPAETLMLNDETLLRIKSLESEIVQKQSIINKRDQALETMYDELNSINEKLLSSNEDLMSTNEELQSVNEQLHVLNFEYQKTIGNYKSSDNNADHLFSLTNKAFIFLGPSYQVLRFTPRSSILYSLTEFDKGRSILDFSFKGIDLDINHEITQIFDGKKDNLRKEIFLKCGAKVLIEILPSKDQESGAILGLIISAVDFYNEESVNA